MRAIVVIGGGQAGAQAIFSLRQWGYDGDITLIGDEAALPYQRPPLSKAFMKGEFAKERLFFKPAAWYENNGVACILSTRVRAIDRKARSVEIEQGGGAHSYDSLILATGSRPRALSVPGAQLIGVHDLRTLADAERMRPAMTEGSKLVIVGAGYIGLEVAASARRMGLQVTVLEMAPRVLARVTSTVMSAFFEQEHRAQGVDIRLDARLAVLGGRNGRVSEVRLEDGTCLPADLVLAGIGILPNEEIAADAGLACSNGIRVDADGRTSDPSIFAIGDCARRPLRHYGRESRLESVHNAIEQGKCAAAAILGRPRPAEDCPWFWSDHYDLKLQIAGLSEGHDDMVIRGDRAERKFAVFYFKQGRLIAVDAINSPAEFMVSKKLIMDADPVRSLPFEDVSIAIKDIVAAQ